MDTDVDWVEDEDVPPRLRARILALKVCRNRCLAHASTDTALEVATPVLKMLSTLIGHGGSYSGGATDELVSHVFNRVYFTDYGWLLTARRSNHACGYKLQYLFYISLWLTNLRTSSTLISSH
jgi:hypothetical protein